MLYIHTYACMYVHIQIHTYIHTYIMTCFGVFKLFDIKFAGYQQPARHSMYIVQ